MIFLTDQIGRTQQCLYLIEHPSFQPKTQEVFWNITAVGYDGIRRTILFSFSTEKEMHKKYDELRKEYLRQAKEEICNKTRKWDNG